MRINIIIFLILLLTSNTFATDFEWWLKIQKIKPLISTRNEVEAIVGKPEMLVKDSAIYNISKGRLDITYSNNKCNSEENEGWNAPEGMVIDLFFTLEYEVELSKFVDYTKIDLDKFSIKKGKADTPPSIPYNYDYEDDGINFLVLERFNKRFLRSVLFYIPDNYNYPKCK